MWWYLDAISDDQNNAITIIAFIGSAFSPYYALARARGRGNPHNHCAINVALYGQHNRWALTERTQQDLVRSKSALEIGPSSLRWDGECLNIAVNECTAPIPSSLRGKVRVTPSALSGLRFPLDADEKHHWAPLSPQARVEVSFDSPALAWHGTGYLDTNSGMEPLERAFKRWNWSRSHSDGSTIVFYDVERRDGERSSIATVFDRDGPRPISCPPERTLPKTFWRVGREIRSETPEAAKLVTTLEDTPFYARSIVQAQVLGSSRTFIHEGLDLDRVANPIVRCMLPFRMPRRRWSR